MSKFLLSILLLGSTVLPVWAEAPLAQVSSMHHLQGQIVDAQTGLALSSVYIRQQNTLNTVISDAQGQFKITLQAGAEPTVMFQAEGYESVSLAFHQNQGRVQIRLQPLAHYRPEQPAHHTLRQKTEPVIFGSQFTAFYQGNYTLFRQENTAINGLVLNEWGIGTDLQPFQTPLTFRGRFFRSRIPVEVANFPFQPAFFINRQQAKISGGWVHTLDGPLEFYLGGDVLLETRSPDNRNNQDQQPVLFTGSLLDREQTRLGIGVNAAWGWRFAENWTLFPEVSLYPVGFNFVSAPNSPAYYNLAGDLGAKLRYEISPGVAASAQYNTQLWYSFGASAFDNQHFFSVGISIDPWTLSKSLL